MVKGFDSHWLEKAWRGARACVIADPSWAFFLVFAFSSMVSLPVARAGGKSAIELSSARPEELSNEEWLAFARAVSKLHLPNT